MLAGVAGRQGPSALAQTYPDRTVTIVVTSAAGALTDVLTRAVALKLSQMWGQAVVVENRGGAGYTFAAQAVLRAEHDGYTLLASETGFSTVQPHVHAKNKLSYDPETDFVPVAGFASIPEALLVNPSVPAKSLSELIALAKSKPGALTYGTAGVGTALHTGMLLLESLTGIKLTAVHYRGAAPALNDVIAGHINMIMMGPSVALPAVKAGKLTMLGFGSEKRVPQFPDVPTIAETVPGYDAGVSFGLYAPAGTPPADHRQDQCRRAPDHQRSRNSAKSSWRRWWCNRCPVRWTALAEYLQQGIGEVGQGHPRCQPHDRMMRIRQ